MDEVKAGEYNAITDVGGVLVGQVEAVDGGYLTGTTVVYLPEMAVAGVDVRGGAPGTRETDLLNPVNSNPGVNAVVLTGGSAYGLDTAGGVMSWLAEKGEGVRVGAGTHEVVPIVPAAVIFDLGRGGDFAARPTAEWGRRAIEAATTGPVAQGNVGAGAGAAVGGLKGGVGTASVVLPGGVTVGALAVVNAFGSATDASGRLLSAAYGLPGEFPDLGTPTAQTPPPPVGPPMNTVIAAVATDAPLDKAAVTRMAMVSHDGIARAIDPAHTLLDGDSVFGLSTAPDGSARWSLTDPHRLLQLQAVYAAAAQSLTRAIAHAVLTATSVAALPSYRDFRDKP